MAENGYLPYGRQSIDQTDIQAVTEILQSDWLTTGPVVECFEKAVAASAGTAFCVAVSNGTAALHAAMFAIDIKPGDEVIVPPLTFAATANAVLYQGGIPVFADVDPETLLLDPVAVEQLITVKTKAVIAVDYAGQACDYKKLQALCRQHDLFLISDACHSLGGGYCGEPCGSQADLSVFSFHPVKPIAAAEGGAVVTNDENLWQKMRRFRNHGITTDHRERTGAGTWDYDMVELGFNYRLSDLHAALGLSQLKRLPAFIQRRQQLAKKYDEVFSGTSIVPLKYRDEVSHGYHLYVVRVENRQQVFEQLRAARIGCNVHYKPVYLHSYYLEKLGFVAGLCPAAETAYTEILSLPIYPDLSDDQQQRVISEILGIV